MGGDRFGKIEREEAASGLVRKPKDREKDRFARLETGGDDPGAAAKPESPLVACPKCGRTNRRGSAYCQYCGEVFPEVAERTDGTLEVYEIRCLSCGKAGNRNQKICIWCGHHFVPTEQDILRSGGRVQIEVDGITYSSDDPYLPPFVREAMVKMKQKELTPEETKKVLDGVRAGRAEAVFGMSRQVEKARYRVVGFSLISAGAVLLTIFRALIMRGYHGALILLAIVGGLLSLTGFGYLAAGGQPGDADRFRWGGW